MRAGRAPAVLPPLCPALVLPSFRPSVFPSILPRHARSPTAPRSAPPPPGRSPNRAGDPRGSPSSTRRASSPPASGSTSCSTRAASSSSTGSSPTAPPTSASTSRSIPGDGVVTGSGRIDGRLVYVFSQDFTVFGGSLSEAHAEKICKVMDLALRNGAPVIGLNDSGGARIQEGVVSLGGYADIFLRNTLASGRGPADLRHPRSLRRRRRVQPRHHRFHLHGPRGELHVRHRPQRGEDGDARGGDLRRARRRGRARRDVGRLPLRARLRARVPPGDSRAGRAFSRSTTSTSRRVRATDGSGRPARRRPARPGARQRQQAVRHARRHRPGGGRRRRSSRCTGATRTTSSSASPGWAGARSGIVANQPAVLAGVLDINASLKAARFIRFCDCFNLPVVTFVDVPGFLPGRDPGARRHHQARRQAAVRLLRGDGAQAHGHHPEGLRRRVRRHELQAHPGRREPGLAVGRDRRHGAQRGGRDPVQG